MPNADLAERRQQLDAAREALRAALADLPQERLARRPPASDDPAGLRWSIREVLWHVGDAERCWREWADAALHGEAVTRFGGRPRPAHLNRLPQLGDWLDESRAATLALLARIDDGAALTAPHATPSRERSILEMLDHLASHDREHAAQIGELAALPPREDV